MKHFKYTLIFAALVSSASAMAVEPSGNPSGTVSINGTIRNSTCSIGAPSTTTVNFDISKADINNAKAYDVITRENTPVTILVSNCQNTALGMTVSATAYDPYGATHGLFQKAEDPDSVLFYYVGLEKSAYVRGGDEASLASVSALLLIPSLPVIMLPLLAFAGGMAGLFLLRLLAETHRPMKLALSACWASLTIT